MPGDHHYYGYLLTNKNDNVMYVGVTNNFERRVYEHKTKMIHGFTEKYNVNKLVYFEELSRYFNLSERFWMNMQSRYDIELEKNRLEGRLEKEFNVYLPLQSA